MCALYRGRPTGAGGVRGIWRGGVPAAAGGALGRRTCALRHLRAAAAGDGESSEDMREFLLAIQRIAGDQSLSEVQRLQMIRRTMPPPMFPFETEPGMHGETLVAKSFGHLNDLLFLDSWESAGCVCAHARSVQTAWASGRACICVSVEYAGLPVSATRSFD